MRLLMVVAAALALTACNDQSQTGADPAASASQDDPKPELAATPTPEVAMTPEDPGGFTEDGFTFHTRSGAKHIVRLPSPGSDTWRAASSGAPTVKLTATRKETTPDGKQALIFEYEMLAAGSVVVEFERLEDGTVEGARTITFGVR